MRLSNWAIEEQSYLNRRKISVVSLDSLANDWTLRRTFREILERR